MHQLRSQNRIAIVLSLLLLAGLTLLFFQQLAFTDRILVRGDAYAYFYPYWDARHEAFRSGSLPLWTPDIFMGAPLLANPQLGTFYPPNWPLTPLNAADAIRYSILLHVLWAAVGAYALFRALQPDAGHIPAVLAGVLFGFGGYLGTHIEQINQLQGLAWMPWLFLLLQRLLQAQRCLLPGLLLGAAWALQIFSGHTQTVFISGVGVGLFALAQAWLNNTPRARPLRMLRAVLWLAFAAACAVLLALPQVLPTLELTGISNRGGGFNVQEATAFSLPPAYIGHALLPTTDGLLFGEYVAYLGVIGLGLALWGALASRSRWRWVWLLLLIVGVLFAFGRFNPLYVPLAGLPGFNAFRVPARWLALFALAGAMLAGLGLHALCNRPIRRWRAALVASILLGLMLLARFFTAIDPADMSYGPATPTNPTLVLWGLALAALFGVMLLRRSRLMPIVALSVVLLELLLASAILPYNDLAPRDAYTGQRFTISQMSAYQAAAAPAPMGRMLAISGLQFDPGDKTSLEARYARAGLAGLWGMDAQAVRNALVAVKKQELLFPNLPLTWGIPSVDGFGGGLLPTIHYSQFTSLFLPAGTLRTVDGRLGELLAQPACMGACVPDARYLRMMDVRYLLTDKVFDVWHEGVYFDTTFAHQIEPGQQVSLPADADFAANRLDVLYRGATPQISAQTDEDGVPLSLGERIELGELTLGRWEGTAFNAPIWGFDVLAQTQAVTIHALTLVDARTGDFVSLPRPLLSSDIKIHAVGEPGQQNRAIVARSIQALPDTWQGSEDALRLMAQPDFASDTLILHGVTSPLPAPAQDVQAEVTITHDSATELRLNVQSSHASYLLLRDAYYPGWQASVNDEATTVYRANVMFRAVAVPAGHSAVVMRFEPGLWGLALGAGGLVWLLWVLRIGVRLWRRAEATG